ncbi:MAG: hypothetical protein OXC48_06090, partial [Endozoicomonadaceae bacterium]|nr:hypothetical protein [Endozoicomonadaceae bacterium]
NHYRKYNFPVTGFRQSLPEPWSYFSAGGLKVRIFILRLKTLSQDSRVKESALLPVFCKNFLYRIF